MQHQEDMEFIFRKEAEDDEDFIDNRINTTNGYSLYGTVCIFNFLIFWLIIRQPACYKASAIIPCNCGRSEAISFFGLLRREVEGLLEMLKANLLCLHDDTLASGRVVHCYEVLSCYH